MSELATHVREGRRGLPRTRGGEPWPPVEDWVIGVVAHGATLPAETATAETPSAAPAASAASPTGRHAAEARPVPEQGATNGANDATERPAADEADVAASRTPEATDGARGPALRRGLPRVVGGEPWPPAGHAPLSALAPVSAGVPQTLAPVETAAAQESPAPPEPVAPLASTEAPGPRVVTAPAAAAAQASPAATTLPAAAGTRPAAATPSAEPKKQRAQRPKHGRFTTPQWVGVGLAGVLAVAAAAGILVLAARGLTTFAPVQDFLERYHGEYPLPADAPVGLPAWLGWQHFLNLFLMVLIVRSGLQVRQQKRPPAFFTPKGGGKKISLNLWLHQCLDVAWMLNGVVFVVLLFATGQWMRVVPTSWEVFPNAASAALQYATLEWPVENGWVSYNALQQLAYFLTIFVAAPLAALSGWRMSGLWPSKAKRLTAAYKVEWARAVHFPVMLYFVAFVVVHVVLVLSTGALRNLNHMYAANDSHGWGGFAVFGGSLLVIVAAVVAARPALLAPIASRFGSVSSR